MKKNPMEGYEAAEGPTRQVAEALREQADGMNHESVRRAAVAWATFSLNTYAGNFLTKALDVSRTLAEFATALERDDHGEPAPPEEPE